MRKLFLLAAASGLTWCMPTFAQPAPEVHFCGENIPQNLPSVSQRWLRTLNRQASYIDHLTTLKRRAAAIFPIIEPIIERYGIPKDFKYLPLLESAVVARAVSRRGAAGFWQIMPQTAKRLGLSVARGRDERFNLTKATHAACRYLNDLHDQLGSWMLVAAAYNAGPNYIQALKRRYPERHPITLPFRAHETKAYIYQAVAIKELLTRPSAYRDFLSDRALAQLNKNTEALPASEKQAILAYYESTEKAGRGDGGPGEATLTASISDNPMLTDTATVALLTDEQDEQEAVAEVSILDEEPEPEEAPLSDAAPAAIPSQAPAATNFVSTDAANQLLTRRIGTEPLAEGQICMFEVIRPDVLNGIPVAVGDVLYAHVDMIEPTSGRVYLRTDKLMSGKTQESIPLKLSAVERTKQPGVPIPLRDELAEGWRLKWEQL
ncbi:lytic transglycosylase domain-containing protein [Arsenicibacter rosenii]|uniref:Lytic murein transglycosylase n=1 Tax=Arsenicibacter rosenii TaxID=1750698 RepID=A0A1S2VMV9_9BACT|nr:lytic transglycosylase domain-containing protein [Arsenicibacter rosenii]OIN59730.1 lytic murein transglycosylase [Arsenicibacter rosenii]